MLFVAFFSKSPFLSTSMRKLYSNMNSSPSMIRSSTKKHCRQESVGEYVQQLLVNHFQEIPNG
jgi:hypothetical protein